MKLRIKGNSLRLRVTRTEVATLAAGGRVEETIHLGAAEYARLTYALQVAQQDRPVTLEYAAPEVTVSIGSEAAQQWAGSQDVGIYGEVETGHGPLSLIVEKDFACIDGDAGENEDSYPNPKLSC